MIASRMKVLCVVILATVLGLSQGAPKTPLHEYWRDSLFYERDPYIVGGTVVEGREFPAVVSLRVYGFHNCGGSIINQEWVLTAAHCSDVNPSEATVVVGSNRLSEGTEHNVVSIHAHKDFDRYSTLNDIAVWKVSPPIPLGNGVEAVNLPEKHEETPAGKKATVIGWGYIHAGGPISEDLLKVDINIAAYDKCNNTYGGKIRESQVCAGGDEAGKDACNGDSGGPLYVDNKICGIVSWGNPCAIKGYPTVYTRVAEYIDWIQENMN